MAAKFIRVNNGVSVQVIETDAETIRELFTPEFREDFNISQNGRPTVEGVAVDLDTPITPNITVGFINGASSKS